MRLALGALLLAAVVLPVATVALVARGPAGPAPGEEVAERGTAGAARAEPIFPIEAAPPPRGRNEVRRIALGRALFHDEGLSVDGSTSCASCHVLAEGGDDGRRLSVGSGRAPGIRNAPTVLNAALNFRQFWDGRALTLEEQAAIPLLTDFEMGWPDWESLLTALHRRSDLVQRFAEAYEDGLTRENLVHAIAEFERTLSTPGAAFDRWLLGDDAALTPEELRGYRLFTEVGCAACHQGRNVGGNMFQRIGRLEDVGGALSEDLGRFGVTGREADRRVFKVPGLRNVAHTAPYLHDGSIADLEEVVQLMARHQLGEDLAPEDARAIVAFLHTLSGELPE